MRHKILGDIPGPAASQIIKKIKEYSYDSTFTYPLVIENGIGCYLEDIDGNTYLDFTSNVGSCTLGYAHPIIIEALKSLSHNGAHKIAGQDFYCKEHMEIAEKVLSIISNNFKVFFTNSGAEAVENAIKIAYKHSGPLPGISCINGFHGRTLGALSFTFSKPVQKANFPEFPVKRIKFCTVDGDQEIESLEKILKENSIAFILSEVIQGEGGYNFASQEFVSNLRRCADNYGVPLILDEVQSGLGRTGKWWGFENYNVLPDIITMAKALQVGGTAYKRELEPPSQGVLSSTWGAGSRIDMAVGALTIEIIRGQKLLENAVKIGDILKKGLEEMIGKKGGLVDVRGLGLMIGIEFDNKLTRDLRLIEIFKKGLLLLPAGEKSIRIIPPLVISEGEANEGLEILSDSLN